ncbi:hypothetical protein Y032_0082g1612 [Ancylostoma ceylanicum]|uniref:Uncharacterized protein n=1 Tax=Ancylostoma ceylanicum TaxID=53326 RepID=A0A016TRX0_9BILA|nr:hypothetical protein Y032_0082g1612 [Ancylostoma ceylanicum]
MHPAPKTGANFESGVISVCIYKSESLCVYKPARTCPLGFFNTLNTNMTTGSHQIIDLLITSIFSNFRSGTGKDVSNGVLRCAEYEYDNHFGRGYRFIDFIDFCHFGLGTGKDVSTRVLQRAEYEYDNYLGAGIDLLILSIFQPTLGDG